MVRFPSKFHIFNHDYETKYIKLSSILYYLSKEHLNNKKIYMQQHYTVKANRQRKKTL